MAFSYVLFFHFPSDTLILLPWSHFFGDEASGNGIVWVHAFELFQIQFLTSQAVVGRRRTCNISIYIYINSRNISNIDLRP